VHLESVLSPDVHREFLKTEERGTRQSKRVSRLGRVVHFFCDNLNTTKGLGISGFGVNLQPWLLYFLMMSCTLSVISCGAKETLILFTAAPAQASSLLFLLWRVFTGMLLLA